MGKVFRDADGNRVVVGDGLAAIELEATTNGSGAATATYGAPINGLLYAVKWVDGDLADGVDAVLSYVDKNGVVHTLLTLTDANNDAVYYPRLAQHDNVGAALSGQYGYPLVDGAPRLVISSGGDTKTGGVVLYFLT